MDEVVLIILVSFSVIANAQDGPISDEDYNLLPPIFHMDPYEECVEKQNMFCRVSLTLSPRNFTHLSPVWKLIQQINQSSYTYVHNKLSHALCLEKSYHQYPNNQHLRKEIEDSYNNKYREKELVVTVDEINCDNFYQSPGIYDFVVLFILIFYSILLIYASFTNIHFQNQTLRRIIECFSLRTNLKKSLETYHHSPFGKLKRIQTVRLFLTAVVVFVHAAMSCLTGYIINTKYFENLFENTINYILICSNCLIIQINFLLSGWLLSYNTFKVYYRNPGINLYKFAVLTLCNRYLRFIPNVIILTLVLTTVWPYQLSSGPIAGMYVYTGGRYHSCRNNWWATILFLNNHFYKNEMCSAHLWYLSTDIQLYIVSLICLVAALKFPKSKKLIMGMFFMLGIIIPSTMSYVYNLDLGERFSPEFMRHFYKIGMSDLMHATHTSIYTNMPSYMLGVIFGYIYFRFEDKKLFGDKIIHVVLWWIFSIGPVLAAAIMMCFRYNRLMTVILAGIVKPLFALGAGIWILGMSLGIVGSISRIFEWKPFVFLATFSYSVYIFHFELVNYKTTTMLKPFELSDYYYFYVSSTIDIILSFICGIIMYFVVEMPFAQLQSAFVPKANQKLHLEEKHD